MNRSAQQILTRQIPTRRILCVWLTHWPLQRLAATRAELNGRAVLVYEAQARRGLAVVSYSPALGSPGRPLKNGTDSELAGRSSDKDASGEVPVPIFQHAAAENAGYRIEPGMSLAEALALHQWAGLRRSSKRGGRRPGRTESVHLEAHDPLADRLALVQLAEWCQQFSPIVGLEEGECPESLLLDIGKVSERFGGERALARQVTRSLAQRRFYARLAVADSVGAAWGLAHYGRLSPIVSPPDDSQSDDLQPVASTASASRLLIAPPGCLPEALADLPIAALRLDAKALDDLGQLGVQRVEQLTALPRAGLATRFGHALLRRLDEALAVTAEVITSCRLPAQFEAAWLLESPTSRQDEIEYVLGQLLSRLTGPLALQRRGVLQLAGRLDCPPAESCQVVLRLFRPSASSQHLLDMFRLRLETIRLRSPVTAIHLAVTAADRLQFEQQTLFTVDSHQTEPRHLAQAVDRLTHRLGREAVLQPLLLADAQPEYACQYLPLTRARDGGKSSRGSSLAAGKQRPAGRPLKMGLASEPHHANPAKNRGSEVPVPIFQHAAGQPRAPVAAAAASQARPTRLYLSPIPLHNVAMAPDGAPLGFHYQGSQQRVAQAWGPQRIETGWWRTRLVRRDYYRVETATAERYWLFRCLTENRWFLQGAFD
jgi:protein ImuB